MEPLYRDLRSHKRGLNRESKQSAKYYRYRGVDPKWIGQPYVTSPCVSASTDSVGVCNKYMSCWHYRLEEQGAEAESKCSSIKIWTKQDMYYNRDINIWPFRGRRHRSERVRNPGAWKWTEVDIERRVKQKAKFFDFELEDQNTGDLSWLVELSRGSAVDSELSYQSACLDRDLRDYIYEDVESYAKSRDVRPISHDNTSSLNQGELDEQGDDDDFSIISENEFDVMSKSSGISEESWADLGG